ncbi:MAG TPA: hypothetical protein VNS09_02705 [Solirubrobacter sp.]|nr:hypothetical protein [Solirubrobacter sp.]
MEIEQRQTSGDGARIARWGFAVLDSSLLSRIGRLGTFARLVVAVALLLIGLLAVGAVVVDRAGWIALACFVSWAALAGIVAGGFWLSRAVSAISSPYERLAIAHGLPGSKATLLRFLARAEAEGRAFVAEAMVMETLGNHAYCCGVARRFAAFEAEVGSVIASSEFLDERWSWSWSRRSQSADDAWRFGPLTLELSSQLAHYMANRTRAIGRMIEFLETGNEDGVRTTRALMRAEAATIAKGETPWLRPVEPLERVGASWPKLAHPAVTAGRRPPARRRPGR